MKVNDDDWSTGMKQLLNRGAFTKKIPVLALRVMAPLVGKLRGHLEKYWNTIFKMFIL